MKRLSLILIALVVIGIAAYFIFMASAGPSQPTAQVIAAGTAPAGFAMVTAPGTVDFPDAHGAHPEYQTEWWYYTGNLDTEEGRHFGFELTFFRRGLIPSEQEATRDSKWATSQVYFAHFTVSDIDANRFYYFEDFGRGALGIAGAESDPYHIWVENWKVEETGEDTYRLYASKNDITLELTMDDLKGPILHGEGGYMPTGPTAGEASYYYSQPRLDSTGTLQIEGRSYEVSGLTWMDRQYGISEIQSADQVGWDWFAFHLDDGSELMLYQLRQPDGSPHPYSRGTFIAADGTTTDVLFEDFEIEVKSTWRSPHTGTVYPARWTIRIPSLDMTLDVEPYMADQELAVSTRYWEGAVEVRGSSGGGEVDGSGYVELTGYESGN